MGLGAAALKEAGQNQVLNTFTVQGVGRDSYQLWLGHELLGALCPSWEDVRGAGWCGCMGDDPAKALALIFGEDVKHLTTNPEAANAILSKILDRVDRSWFLDGAADDMDMPQHDKEDVVPQLCEWVRTGMPAHLANSAAVMRGALSD